MSSFSSIYFNGNLYPLTANTPPLATDFWLSGEFTNNGITSLIIYLHSACNNGAGLSALRVMIVESVLNQPSGGFQNFIIAEANLTTPFFGGLPAASRNAIIFNQIGLVNNFPTQTGNLWGNNQTLIDQDGKSVFLNGSATRGAVSATAYIPEKFRILIQNTGTAQANIANILIRTIE